MRFFLPVEDQIIKDSFEQGYSDTGTRDLLYLRGFLRSPAVIRKRRYRLGLCTRRLEKPCEPRERRKVATTGDHNFKKAMLAAIKGGAERAIIGVVKDRRPWSLKRAQPEPVVSGCSSPESWV